MAILGAAGLLDGLLHRLQHLLALDHFFARDGVGDEKKLGAGNCGVHHGVSQSGFLAVEVASISASVSTRRALRISVSGKRGLGAVVEPHAGILRVGAQHHAGKPLAAIHRDGGLGAGLVAGKPVPVFDAGQRAVNAGGTHLQHPGPGDRVVYVQHGAHRVADRLAILHRDQVPVGPVGHDLHRGAVAAEHRNAHKLVAHVGQRGSHDGGNARVQAGQERVVVVVQNKKGGP